MSAYTEGDGVRKQHGCWGASCTRLGRQACVCLVVLWLSLTAVGIPPDVVTRYLDHLAFTPRHDTILVASLAHLGSAHGRDKFLEVTLEADDEVDATCCTNVAQIMRGYHETVAPITALHMVGRLVVAQAGNGDALVPLPIDYCVWTKAADHARAVVATGNPL